MRKSKGLDAKRSDRKKRSPKLGAYMIVTDTEKTEKMYFEGLKTSLPKETRDNLLIKIHNKKDIKNMISFAREEKGRDPRYRDIWLIIDRDEFKDFDIFIGEALREELNVGWSNPCFEVWLSAYFGPMLIEINSKNCCNKFEEVFIRNTGKRDYKKGDPKLYEDLCKHGDENNAIKRAINVYESKKTGKRRPSQLEGCTTVCFLVNEIKSKIE